MRCYLLELFRINWQFAENWLSCDHLWEISMKFAFRFLRFYFKIAIKNLQFSIWEHAIVLRSTVCVVAGPPHSRTDDVQWVYDCARVRGTPPWLVTSRAMTRALSELRVERVFGHCRVSYGGRSWWVNRLKSSRSNEKQGHCFHKLDIHLIL